MNVLLIDGDLRRGHVGPLLDLGSAPGLSELLQGTATDDDVVRTARSDGGEGRLDVIAAGAPPSKRPVGPLTPERIRTILARLAPRYSLVVVDTPPVNLLADAGIIGSAADAVLLVARAGHTNADELRYAVEQLMVTRAAVAGLVLTDVDRRTGARDDDSYRYLAAAARYV
jgi:tyrosine-protein kinase Etk/Wzc